MQSLRVTQLLVASFLLSACAPLPTVEVVERTTISAREQTEKIGGSLIRIVEPGDSLHSIAFSTRQNVNDIAAWNQLSDTSRLFVGQRIRMTKPLNFEPIVEQPIGVASKPTGTERAAIVAIEMLPMPNSAPPAISEPPAINEPPANTDSLANHNKPSVSDAAQSNQPSPKTPPNSVGAVNSSTAPQPPLAKGPVQWTWPTSGKVVGLFALAQGKQGIDIQGKLGQPVIASGAGEVVYVGNGLKGYGNLVIIKHNENFLSAYAHNHETFVTEGQRVNARHTIGSIGLDRERRGAMHFQIRKNGKPVNPLAYLPNQ